MKRPAQKAFVLENPKRIFLPLGTLAICVVIMLIAGCEEQNLSSTKKSRLIAVENMELKKELEQRGEEIKRLQEQHEKQIKQQEQKLAICLKQKEAFKKQLGQNIQEKVGSVVNAVMQENKKLRKENEGLKAQIEKLKTELEEAKKLAATVTS